MFVLALVSFAAFFIAFIIWRLAKINKTFFSVAKKWLATKRTFTCTEGGIFSDIPRLNNKGMVLKNEKRAVKKFCWVRFYFESQIIIVSCETKFTALLFCFLLRALDVLLTFDFATRLLSRVILKGVFYFKKHLISYSPA